MPRIQVSTQKLSSVGEIKDDFFFSSLFCKRFKLVSLFTCTDLQMLLLCAFLSFRIETRGAVQTEGVQSGCHTGQTKWQHRSGQTLLPHCQGKKQCVWHLT